MANPVEFMVADLREKYEAMPSSRAFDRLYDDPEWGHMFAVLHKRLNEHFTDINGRAETTHHYWADNSRDLLSLTREIETDLHTLRRAGVEVELANSYQDALERCRRWLSPSGGSAVPEDFEAIEVIAYEPVLTYAAKSVKLEKHQEPIELKMVGSGSYAHVYSYMADPSGSCAASPPGHADARAALIVRQPTWWRRCSSRPDVPPLASRRMAAKSSTLDRDTTGLGPAAHAAERTGLSPQLDGSRARP